MLKSLAIESLIEASAVQSLVGCTRLYGLHKALQAEPQAVQYSAFLSMLNTPMNL
jgi:hypothetical protein